MHAVSLCLSDICLCSAVLHDLFASHAIRGLTAYCLQQVLHFAKIKRDNNDAFSVCRAPRVFLNYHLTVAIGVGDGENTFQEVRHVS